MRPEIDEAAGVWLVVPASPYETDGAEGVSPFGSEVEALRAVQASIKSIDRDGMGGLVALFVPYGTTVANARWAAGL